MRTMSWGKLRKRGGKLHSYAPPQTAIVLTGCGVDRGDTVCRDARIMKITNFHMMILLIHSFLKFDDKERTKLFN